MEVSKKLIFGDLDHETIQMPQTHEDWKSSIYARRIVHMPKCDTFGVLGLIVCGREKE